MKKRLMIMLLAPFLSLITFITPLIIYFPKDKIWLSLIIILLSFVVSIPLSVFIHEFGHLVFGRLSGYKFLQFRFLNIVFLKDEKMHIRFERMNLMMLGQCIMSPPKYSKKKKIKFQLYNFGGLIFTYSLTLLSLVLLLIINNPYVKMGLIDLLAVNIFFSISNSIYIDGGYNDMCNHVIAKKNPEQVLNILYSLEVTRNIILNKGYSAKTSYPIYLEGPLNHISFPVILFKLYGAFEKEDYNLAEKYYDLLRNNFSSIEFLPHRVLGLLELAYCDIVLGDNINSFKGRLIRINAKQKEFLRLSDPTLYAYYNILLSISNGSRDISKDIFSLDKDNDLDNKEYLSLRKRLTILNDKIREIEKSS